MEPSRRIAVQALLVALRDRFGAITPDAETGQMLGAGTETMMEPEPAPDLDIAEANAEIQRKLAEVLARFRERTRAQVSTQD